MRLSPEQIKQGILHPEREVRNAAVYYFADSFSPDATVMPLAIQAIEKHGWNDAFRTYRFLKNLVQTEESLAWTIDRLRERGQPTDEEEAEPTLRLLSILTNADPILLRDHEADILELEAVDEEVQEAIQDAIRLLDVRPDGLWRELEEFCQRNVSEGYVSDDEMQVAYRLVEALARYPESCKDRVLSILVGEIDDYTDDFMMWLEPLAVRLAGAIQLNEAIPLIIDRYKIQDDELRPECLRALVKIGTSGVVDALADRFHESEWEFRFDSIAILEKIHSDHTVARCMALFEKGEDLTLKCRLCEAVLMQFADDGIEPARRLILENDLDPDLVEVRRALLNASMLMDIEFPESQRWRDEAEHDVELRMEWYAEHVSTSPDDYEDDEYADEAENYHDEPLPPTDTVVLEQPKVGRNDPCPCGSGRKYKKCCLNKGNGRGVLE
jgi:HEAT repeat protein